MAVYSKRRLAVGVFLIGFSLLLAVFVVPTLVASGDSRGAPASSHCIPRHAVKLDRGVHAGNPWRVNASIEKIGRHHRCSFWFLKVQFLPEGKQPGSWTEGWGIPAGGHLPPDATIDASEEEEGESIGGVVGSRVHSVVFTFDNGRKIVVYPMAPSERLQMRFVWLRDLRYFLTHFAAGEHVVSAKLLDANGKRIFSVHSQEGELIGPMVE